MNKLRTRPDLIIALLIAVLAIFLAAVILLNYMPSLPYVKNY